MLHMDTDTLNLRAIHAAYSEIERAQDARRSGTLDDAGQIACMHAEQAAFAEIEAIRAADRRRMWRA